MSMRDIPCSGNVIKASDLIKELPPNQQLRYAQCCDNGDWESVQTILEEHMPKEFPPITEAFTLNSDVTPAEDDLEEGVVYVNFDDSDLYTRIETPAHKALKAAGITPQFTRWSVWG